MIFDTLLQLLHLLFLLTGGKTLPVSNLFLKVVSRSSDGGEVAEESEVVMS